MNQSGGKISRQPNPVSSASILSKLTFWWLKPMFKIGLKRTIEEDDIYAVTNDMKSYENSAALSQLWERELMNKNPSIFRTMLKFHGFTILVIGILYAICEAFAKFIQPVCLGILVSYFAQTDDVQITRQVAYQSAVGIVLSTGLSIITYHPFYLFIFKTACTVRVAFGGLIYRKALRLLKSSTEEGQSGKIINLLSNDLAKLELALQYLHDVWKGPLQLIAFFIVMYLEIGAAALIGMAFLIFFIPLQVWIGRISALLRFKNIERSDIRVKIMNEILNGIQVIKMYAWEKSFAKLVDQIRKREVDSIRSIAYVRATILSLPILSKISVFLSLITYVYCGNVITARKVFIVSSYFNHLKLSLLDQWPVAIMQAAEAFISIKRLGEFLLRSESKHLANVIDESCRDKKWHSKKLPNNELAELLRIHNNQHKNDEKFSENYGTFSGSNKIQQRSVNRVHNIDTIEKCIRLENVSAIWQQSECDQMNGIVDFSTKIKHGLTAIVGPVGSGKSSLLNVILGELELDTGKLTVNGSISYASQEPWIFGGTVRSNIVFVEEFDEHRYNKVVEVCALERDFKLLPQGDETVVGEHGSSLSGGQKARVNLARAIYKQSDIYLLDDPLSAVDAHVGKHIFERCMIEFLADKICVLVTHQLQYLKKVNHIILMKKGKIEAEGPFNTLQKLTKESLMYGQEDGEQKPIEMVPKNRSTSISSSITEFEDDPDDRREHQLTGSRKLSTYKALLKASQSNIYVIFVCVMFLVAQFLWSYIDFFLSAWVNWEEANSEIVKAFQNDANSLDYSEYVKRERSTYLTIYTSIIIFGKVVYIIRSFSFFHMFVRISINLHDMIFRGVSRANMVFFNNNPSGRILNRFARDINNIDTLLPKVLFDVCECFLNYVGIVLINVIVNPWLSVPALIMSAFFYFLRIIYINTGRSFKRVEALSRSPIFSHVNASIHGAATVRAFNACEILEKEFHEFQDHNTSSYYLFVCSSRWFALSLDMVCLLFITVVTFSFLLLENSMTMESGQVGLAILSSVSLIGISQWGVRQSAELENQMTSVDRVIEYTELPSEPPLESDQNNAPPSDWPQHGNIEFKLLSMRYTENGPRTLRNLTFRINAKEKIGVVGRTGAGKSSIIQSLFRLAQNDGQIFIDGVDIGVIGLHDLRKKISIIPQEAVLFSGSLRFNLDPFGEKSDEELWDSLEQVEMKTVASSMPGGLDGKVQDGGSNFSAGQRQLLCLARAILRNNKILILDEATANVDSDTDQLIQDTIRSKFADCTVITIAHRLHTVMDSDKVLVVDAGDIVEFDHPFELIMKSNGIFKQLIDQTGSSAALTLVAKDNYERRYLH